MKKQTFSFLIALLLIIAACASALGSLSIDELVEQKKEIEQELISRGYYPLSPLQKGDEGDAVVRLQDRLTELYYFDKAVDGQYGQTTVTAVKAFQKDNDMEQDGIATIDVQEQLFSQSVIAKATPTPKPTKAPTATPKPTNTPDPRKAYGKFNFKDVARNPDNYEGDMVKISGRVLQTLGDKNSGFDLRVATKGRYDDVVYIVVLNADFNILEDDKIDFYCTLEGSYTYESTMGQQITLPLAFCDFFEIKN